jgi:hypothetical protein
MTSFLLIVLHLEMLIASHAWVCARPLKRTWLRMQTNGADLVAAKTVTTLDPVPSHVHRIILMRHGESEFNNANVFTGWSDIGKGPGESVLRFAALAF